jgi:hypothetical protein
MYTNHQTTKAFELAKRYLKHNKRISTSKYNPVIHGSSPGTKMSTINSEQNIEVLSLTNDPKFFKPFSQRKNSRSKDKTQPAM